MITVFCIDDEVNTEKMISKFELMKKRGINVIGENSISNVFNRLNEIADQIDLILLDIIMPPDNHYSVEETNGGTNTGFRLLIDIRKNIR